MPEKIYKGRRIKDAVGVKVDGVALNPRFDLHEFDQRGFDWGCGNNRSTQLALALLADHLGDDEKAMKLCHSFKLKIVAYLPAEEWELTSSQLEQELAKISV